MGRSEFVLCKGALCVMRRMSCPSPWSSHILQSKRIGESVDVFRRCWRVSQTCAMQRLHCSFSIVGTFPPLDRRLNQSFPRLIRPLVTRTGGHAYRWEKPCRCLQMKHGDWQGFRAYIMTMPANFGQITKTPVNQLQPNESTVYE